MRPEAEPKRARLHRQLTDWTRGAPTRMPHHVFATLAALAVVAALVAGAGGASLAGGEGGRAPESVAKYYDPLP